MTSGWEDYMPRIFTNFPVATYGVALKPNSSSARNPVTFWSNFEPSSDDTSMRNSAPMCMSQSAQAPASGVETGKDGP